MKLQINLPLLTTRKLKLNQPSSLLKKAQRKTKKRKRQRNRKRKRKMQT